jgi:hypothetical protein
MSTDIKSLGSFVLSIAALLRWNFKSSEALSPSGD